MWRKAESGQGVIERVVVGSDASNWSTQNLLRSSLRSLI